MRKERWEQNLAVRKWTAIGTVGLALRFNMLDVDMEFRGFVKDHKLTCVSQYN